MDIVVIGTGYVGLVSGTCFAEMGNNVICVDIDKRKIDNLNKGIIPIYEPGLEEILQRNILEKRISFSNSIRKTLNKAKIIFLAVGTPESKNGSPNMNYIYSVVKEIGQHLSQEAIIITKSTVPVGTSSKVYSIIDSELKYREKKIKFHVASNPEFLKEGDAVNDFMRPDRIIIGTESKYALNILKRLYSPYVMKSDRLICMGIKEAELTKYVANAMLATKISFINEIANICDNLEIDIETIRKGIGSDSRIGYSFIYPGSGYGGSCFSKDIKAIIHLAKKSGVDPFILESVEKRNSIQKNIIYKYVMKKFNNNIVDKVIAVWGLSFKPGTDDIRESPALTTINSLINSGATVKAYDPASMNKAREVFPQRWLINNKIIFTNDNYSALDGVDALIIMTEWKMFRNPIISKMKKNMKKLNIFDGRNQYDPNLMKEEGFYYKGIGR